MLKPKRKILSQEIEHDPFLDTLLSIRQMNINKSHVPPSQSPPAIPTETKKKVFQRNVNTKHRLTIHASLVALCPSSEAAASTLP